MRRQRVGLGLILLVAVALLAFLAAEAHFTVAGARQRAAAASGLAVLAAVALTVLLAWLAGDLLRTPVRQALWRRVVARAPAERAAASSRATDPVDRGPAGGQR